MIFSLFFIVITILRLFVFSSSSNKNNETNQSSNEIISNNSSSSFSQISFINDDCLINTNEIKIDSQKVICRSLTIHPDIHSVSFLFSQNGSIRANSCSINGKSIKVNGVGFLKCDTLVMDDASHIIDTLHSNLFIGILHIIGKKLTIINSSLVISIFQFDSLKTVFSLKNSVISASYCPFYNRLTLKDGMIECNEKLFVDEDSKLIIKKGATIDVNMFVFEGESFETLGIGSLNIKSIEWDERVDWSEKEINLKLDNINIVIEKCQMEGRRISINGNQMSCSELIVNADSTISSTLKLVIGQLTSTENAVTILGKETTIETFNLGHETSFNFSGTVRATTCDFKGMNIHFNGNMSCDTMIL